MRWPALLPFLSLIGCYQPAHTLSVAARREVMSTATCTNVDVEHVPFTDVAGQREDVYVAEGCGNRWRMTCESKHVTVCPRRSRKNCHVELQWSCDNVQPEDYETTEDDLRARVVHPDDMNLLGS
jgi:hypothetical protein